MGLAIAPVPEPAGAIARAELVPEQAVRPNPQFGEVGAGGYRLFGTEALNHGR
ncbi:hypothetical protein D3C73_1661600 [compost metagenome]